MMGAVCACACVCVSVCVKVTYEDKSTFFS